MMSIRELHAWIGMLIAPATLYMATTGVLQIIDLHEVHGGYTPAPLLVRLASVHKDQTLQLKPAEKADRDADADRPAAPRDRDRDEDGDKRNPKLAVTLLKAFFIIAGLGLIVSTSLGLWMAWQQKLRRRTNLALFAVGTLLPLALVLLT
jgi:hypothetical protein